MRICIVGAGAIGGLLASGLAEAKHEISLVTRGPHFETIKTKGLQVISSNGKTIYSRPHVFNRLNGIGPQDLIILALKAHQVSAVCPFIPLLFHENTIVVTLQNGIPFWYFQGIDGPYKGLPLNTVDPSGTIISHIPYHRIVHSVVYPAAEIIQPGVIQHHEGDRFPVGEPDNTSSERINKVSRVFSEAGFRSPVLQDTRGEIWLKLLGNLSFNPISALTHATVIEMLAFSETRALIETMMAEGQAVANKLGVTIRLPIERRISGAEKLGEHKMSMLQDTESGKALEIDALVGAVAEIGQHIGIPTPCIQTLFCVTKLLEKKMLSTHSCVQLTPKTQ